MNSQDCAEKIFQNIIKKFKRLVCIPDTTQSAPQVKIKIIDNNNLDDKLEEKFISCYCEKPSQTQIKRSVDGWLTTQNFQHLIRPNDISNLVIPYDVKLYDVNTVGFSDGHIEQYKRAHSNVLFFIYDKRIFPYPNRDNHNCKNCSSVTCDNLFFPFYITTLEDVIKGVRGNIKVGSGYEPGRIIVENKISRGPLHIYRQTDQYTGNTGNKVFIYEAMTFHNDWPSTGNFFEIIDIFIQKSVWRKF